MQGKKGEGKMQMQDNPKKKLSTKSQEKLNLAEKVPALQSFSDKS